MTRSRAAVLAATTALVQERGVAGTSIEAVAQRAGVAKTTIYRQWPDQAALVRDALAGSLREHPVPDTGTVRDDLLELTRGLARALESGPAAGLMLSLLDAAERDAGFREVHRDEATARHRVVTDVVRRAVDRGDLPPGTDPATVLDLLAGPLFHRRWFGRSPLDDEFCVAVVDAALAQANRAVDAG
ncbi:TetR/AcrR family transcriptional regulator [Cellulomonas sp. Y8]|uniref:TetR/AcrR family transcriptional regulator n=1 Tax=Cellulomonas sp. Y8 TaxID=2591145 RepID=UPI003D7333B6